MDRLMALKMQEQLYQGYDNKQPQQHQLGGGGLQSSLVNEFLNKPPPVPVSYMPQESLPPPALFHRQKHEVTDLPPTPEAVSIRFT